MFALEIMYLLLEPCADHNLSAAAFRVILIGGGAPTN
jgi:hypothetical protein